MEPELGLERKDVRGGRGRDCASEMEEEPGAKDPARDKDTEKHQKDEVNTEIPFSPLI